MADVNLSMFDPFLKVHYLKGIRDTFNKESFIYAQLKKLLAQADVSGKNFTQFLQRGFGQGLGARADVGTLPLYGTTDPTTTVIPVRYLYGRKRVSGPTIASSQGGGAAAEALDYEIKDLQNSFIKDCNRQFWSDGSGALCYLTSAVATTSTSTSTTDDNAGNAFSYARKNMRVDLIDTDNTTKNWDSNVINSASNSKVIFTAAISGPNAGANGDFLVREDSYKLEMMGLKGIVDSSNPPTGNLQAIDRDTAGNDYWQAEVIASGGTLEETEIQKGIDDVRLNGGRTRFLCSTQGVRRKYFELLVGDRRYSKTLTFTGGWETLAYAGGDGSMGFHVDVDAWPQRLYGLDPESMCILQLAAPGWVTDNKGQVLQTSSVGTGGIDAVEFTWKWYANLAAKSPNHNFVITGITE